MSFTYIITDPAGDVHTAYSQDEYDAVVDQLTAKFPNETLLIRASVNDQTESEEANVQK